MKIIQSLYILSIATLMLTGCNRSSLDLSSNQVKSAVYLGIGKDENENLLQVQIINEAGKTLLISFWDDRNHQTSYRGKMNSLNKVLFNAVQYECEFKLNLAICNSPMGNVTMAKYTISPVKLSEYSGTYKTNWNDELYTMVIDHKGKVNISSNQCHIEGVIVMSKNIENIFSLTQDDCNIGNIISYVQLNLDNENLYSINIQTDTIDFPQTWVKQ